MTRVLLVNASAPAYNLGLHKARDWWRGRGAVAVDLVDELPTLFIRFYDVVWISAIFSWHMPALLEAARAAIAAGRDVEVGGPGTFGVRELVRRELGFRPTATPDPRFETEPGPYRMVFWSRGCPAKNCTLGYPPEGRAAVCSVPAMEGARLTLYADARPAPVILDNNLSALPRAHQERIVERTLAAGFHSVDANSGFEPRSVRAWTIETWRRLPLVAWRYAYDELAERPAVLRVLDLLTEAGIPRRRSRIYCLAGNEPLAACEQRVMDIVGWGAYPIVQRRRPLDWIAGPLPTLHDWTEQRLIDFQRWGNRLARGLPFSEYRRGWKDHNAAGELV